MADTNNKITGSLKAVAAGLSALAIVLPTVSLDGVISQTDYYVIIASVLAPVIITYLTPNQNSDGSWGAPDLSGVQELTTKLTNLIVSLASLGVLKPSDPVVQETPEAAAVAVATPEPVPVVVVNPVQDSETSSDAEQEETEPSDIPTTDIDEATTSDTQVSPDDTKVADIDTSAQPTDIDEATTSDKSEYKPTRFDATDLSIFDDKELTK